MNQLSNRLNKVGDERTNEIDPPPPNLPPFLDGSGRKVLESFKVKDEIDDAAIIVK